jgi:hypothetical protein
MQKLSLTPLFGLGFCAICAAQAPVGVADEVRNGFYSRINVIGYGLRQDTVESTLNAGNGLGIPRDTAVLEFRPDFNVKLRQFEFDLKPRFQWARDLTVYADSLPVSGTRQQAFVNEGYVRFRIHDRLILSYGRENLQWGPSALLSPSNPFNANNGRNNPNLELPGLDYARAVLVASPKLTISLIDNTGRGRLDQSERFRKAAAAKVDYTGEATFASVIVSKAKDEPGRIGAFAGWNVTDALSIRAEGSAGRNDPGSALVRRDRQLLVGTSYTLAAGPTLSAEYFLNQDGCPDLTIRTCLLQRYSLIDPLRPLVRRRYAMLQYVDTKIGGSLNLSTRLIKNLDDNSAQLVISLEYELGQHWQLYAIPTFYHGTRESEFGSVLRRSLFFGASYTF